MWTGMILRNMDMHCTAIGSDAANGEDLLMPFYRQCLLSFLTHGMLVLLKLASCRLHKMHVYVFQVATPSCPNRHRCRMKGAASISAKSLWGGKGRFISQWQGLWPGHAEGI